MTHDCECPELRAEVERLHHDFTMADAAVKNQRATVLKWQAEVVALRAEVDRYKKASMLCERQEASMAAEIERLRGALEKIALGYDPVTARNVDAKKLARAALGEEK